MAPLRIKVAAIEREQSIRCRDTTVSKRWPSSLVVVKKEKAPLAGMYVRMLVIVGEGLFFSSGGSSTLRGRRVATYTYGKNGEADNGAGDDVKSW